MFFIVQLVQIDVAKNVLIPEGWTVIPIFKNGTNYVSLGNFQFPVMKGQCLKRMIARMKKKGVEDALLDLIESEEIRLSKGCLNIRLCDGRRMEELPVETPVELNEISQMLNLRLVNNLRSSSTISSLIPKSSNRSEFEAKTIKILNEVSISNSYIV